LPPPGTDEKGGTVVAQRQLFDKQLIERLNPGDLTLFRRSVASSISSARSRPVRRAIALIDKP
jgi:hypothetical protein